MCDKNKLIEMELRRRLQAYVDTGKIQWKEFWEGEKSVFEGGYHVQVMKELKLKYRYFNKGMLHCLVPEQVYDYCKEEFYAPSMEGGFHCGLVSLREAGRVFLHDNPHHAIMLVFKEGD